MNDDEDDRDHADAPNPYDLDAGTSEHYLDAALYDYEYRRRRADVNHYRRLARAWGTGKPILELGCGTGRVMVPLLRDGHEVIGLDRSPDMLRQAAARIARLPRAARSRARLVRGDLLQLPFAARFSLIIAPFNVLQHLYARPDLEACFEEVRDHLAATGRFAFDVLLPDLRWLTRDARKRWARTRFSHPTTGEKLEYTTNQTYEPISQIAYIRIYYRALSSPEIADPRRRISENQVAPGRTHVVRLAHRQIFPAELEGIVSHTKMRIQDRWGGFSGEDLDGDSESQVLLCKLR